MEVAAVSAATGAIGPVLRKLAALRPSDSGGGEGEHTPPPEVSDIEFITEKLEEMESVLAGLWGREEADLDEHCKDWVVMARELSYDIDDDLMQQRRRRPTNRGKILEDLKVKVMDVSGRLCDKWKSTAELIPNSGKPVDQDPRGRFLHKDASELVGMDKLKAELLELVLAQGEGAAVRFSSPHRQRDLELEGEQMMEHWILFKFMEVNMATTARKLLERMPGVESATVAGDGKDVLGVLGVGLDPLKLRSTLQRKVGPVQLMQARYSNIVQILWAMAKARAEAEASDGHRRADDGALKTGREAEADDGALKTVCFVGYAGAGKTALANMLYNKAAEGGQFQCLAFVSVSTTPNITETLKAILSQLTNEPHDGTQLVSNRSLVHQIWNFLSNRKYLVIVDDIWHRNEWGIIKQSLPNNTLHSRIIMTTRSKDIAEECRTDNTDAFVYDIGHHWNVAKFIRRYTPGIFDDNPCYDIEEMCYGMPLALFCMSSAWAEQMQGPDGGGLLNLRASRHVEDGILSMPCMKPLADSLCRGYDNLPLHLKTLLLYCSIYRWRDTFEKDCLVRRWIAEGFVHEKEAAQCFFEELVRKDWIEPAGGGRYGIHPVMLAFLRCKSQEDNFVDCLAFGSDVSSLCARPRTRRIRRLSLQHGHSDQVKVSESDLELSHTRTLSVFDDASAVPFKSFQLLRVLDLEGTEDLTNTHLLEICGLPWLRYLGLKGTPITMIPPEIGELQHLETLDVRNTAITMIPPEIGKLQHLKTLDVRNTAITMIPPEIGKLQHLETLDVSNTAITMIPPEIWELQHLETLDVRNTAITMIPPEIGELQHLETLDISNSAITMIPPEIGKLQHLETLDISNSAITMIPPEIGELQHLGTLDVRNTAITELPWEAGLIWRSVRVFAGDMELSHGMSLPKGICLDQKNIPKNHRERERMCILLLDRFGMGAVPPHAGLFKVGRTHVHIPKLIKEYFVLLSSLDVSLCKLDDEHGDLKFLQEMPNLQALVLRLEALPREPVTIGGEGFARLESFYLDCRAPRVRFEPGAMPRLKLLTFRFYAVPAPASDDLPLVGITHLEGIQKVVFRCSPWYRPDSAGVAATIAAVRGEAQGHPNQVAVEVLLEKDASSRS